MMRRPSGMYRPGNSFLHGLDPAVKLLCFLLLLAAVVLTDGPVGHTSAIIFTLTLSYLAQLDRKEALSGVHRLRWLIVAILLVNLLFSHPEQAVYRWWILAPSPDGLWTGLGIALRISMLLVLAVILSSTTAPLKLSTAVSTLLKPLSRIGIPTGRAALVISASLRFIPALFEDAENIRRARRARGLYHEKKGFLDVAAAAQPMALPLFVSAFRKADTLAQVLESKGYCESDRGSSFEKFSPAREDWLALFVCAAIFALQAFVL